MAISSKAREILNRPDLIEKRDLWFHRMQNVFDSNPDSWNNQYAFGLCGILAKGIHDPYTEPELWVEDCLEYLAEQYKILENKSFFRPLCIEYFIYGVHYIDKMFGANVFFQDNQWYNHYLTTPIGKLEMPNLDKDPLWSLTKRAIHAFLEADVNLPLFGLPTFASALNIAVNLYGQEILVEMVIDPDNALKDLTTINDLLCQLHSNCRSLIPESQLQPVISWTRTQPPGYGQLCGCTTQLVSAQMYRDLVAPLDDKLLSVYPHGGMIHLCGAHAQLINVFRDMKHLRSIQLNDRATEDLKAYYEGLREDQIIYFNPCKETTIEDAMAITHGNRLIIVTNPMDDPICR